MADTMKGLKRTDYCGDVTEIGKEVVVGGFVDRIRNKGGVIFIVLRDRTGVVQLLFNDETDKDIFERQLHATVNMFSWQRALSVSVKARTTSLKQVMWKFLSLI